MSCPDCADTSAAARAATLATGIWSTVTLILFFDPHSFAKLSNHLSYSGTKWLHCTMLSDFVCAMAREMNGAAIAGARPAAPAAAAVCLRKPLRVTTRSRFLVPVRIAYL